MCLIRLESRLRATILQLLQNKSRNLISNLSRLGTQSGVHIALCLRSGLCTGHTNRLPSKYNEPTISRTLPPSIDSPCPRGHLQFVVLGLGFDGITWQHRPPLPARLVKFAPTTSFPLSTPSPRPLHFLLQSALAGSDKSIMTCISGE